MLIDVTTELKGIYSSLFKAIHEIWLKLSDKTTLLVIDEKQSIIDTHIAQIKPSSVVHAYNNIELFDWERGNQPHWLWYCDDVSKSPMLESAIVKALKKSCHSQTISRLFSKKATSTWYQFMGFVSSHTKEGCLISSKLICDFSNWPQILQHYSGLYPHFSSPYSILYARPIAPINSNLPIPSSQHRVSTLYHQQGCWRWCNTSVLVSVSLFHIGMWHFNPYTGLQ